MPGSIDRTATIVRPAVVATKLTSLNQTNSGPTRPNSAGPLRLWTAAGATDISGKSRSPGVAACEKERVIVPWGRASELLGGGFDAPAPILPLASRSFFEWKDYVTWRRHENLQSSCRCGSIVRPLGHPLSMLLTSLLKRSGPALSRRLCRWR